MGNVMVAEEPLLIFESCTGVVVLVESGTNAEEVLGS
jgi:hypothetical protein